MDTPVQKVTWATRYGIGQRHWDAFRRFAELTRVFLLLRGDHATALPWIEQGFPVRPSGLAALEVDPSLGVLVARSEAQRRQVIAYGHYVLIPASGGDVAGGHYIGMNPRQPPLRVMFRDRWARPGVVIDRRAHRPFTAGYDLVAVIGEGDEFHRFQTLGTAVAATAPLGWRGRADPGTSTRFVDHVRKALNGIIEGNRVLDGTHARPLGPRPARPGADVHDHILVFRPDAGVGLLRSAPGAWARLEVGELMTALESGERRPVNP